MTVVAEKIFGVLSAYQVGVMSRKEMDMRMRFSVSCRPDDKTDRAHHMPHNALTYTYI